MEPRPEQGFAGRDRIGQRQRWIVRKDRADRRRMTAAEQRSIDVAERAARDRLGQRRRAAEAARVRIGAMGEQQFDECRIAIGGGQSCLLW